MKDKSMHLPCSLFRQPGGRRLGRLLDSLIERCGQRPELKATRYLIHVLDAKKTLTHACCPISADALAQ